jgi:hypothetical protein
MSNFCRHLEIGKSVRLYSNHGVASGISDISALGTTVSQMPLSCCPLWAHIVLIWRSGTGDSVFSLVASGSVGKRRKASESVGKCRKASGISDISALDTTVSQMPLSCCPLWAHIVLKWRSISHVDLSYYIIMNLLKLFYMKIGTIPISEPKGLKTFVSRDCHQSHIYGQKIYILSSVYHFFLMIWYNINIILP